MNERSQLHRTKNNQPNHRSTYCRTDNTLHADGVSHSDSHPPPATRGCHPPPEVLLSHICTFARGEAAFAPLHGILTSPCPHAPVPTCPLAASPRSCQRVNLPACPLAQALPPRDLWSRQGSAIQWYGLTPCSASRGLNVPNGYASC